MCQQPRLEIRQRKHGVYGPTRDGKRIFSSVEATRPSELEEAFREELLHSLHVEARLLSPQLAFETLESFTIAIAEFHGGNTP